MCRSLHEGVWSLSPEKNLDHAPWPPIFNHFLTKTVVGLLGVFTIISDVSTPLSEALLAWYSVPIFGDPPH